MAISRRHLVPGVIIHSDTGGQFHAHQYRQLLANHGIKQSMGNAGTSARGIAQCYNPQHPGNNAAMESYFALLQKKW